VSERLPELLAREIVAAIREDPALRDELRALLLPGEDVTSASPWLALEHAASYLNVSTRTVQRAVKLKRLGVSHIGRRPIFKREELDRYVQAAGEEKRQPLHPAARKGA
jgi:excisionase family DNA binding protein